jgi:hypothetical protein
MDTIYDRTTNQLYTVRHVGKNLQVSKGNKRDYLAQVAVLQNLCLNKLHQRQQGQREREGRQVHAHKLQLIDSCMN